MSEAGPSPSSLFLSEKKNIFDRIYRINRINYRIVLLSCRRQNHVNHV